MEKVEPSVPDGDVTADVVIKADSPIRAKEEDLLGRARMAVSVAEVINRSFGDEAAGDESLVAGIEGEWGSGKTSFINLILENLESSANGYLIIKFNPWNFSDQNELVTDFFSSLIDKLKHVDEVGDCNGIKSIRDYCSKLLSRVELKIEPKISVPGGAEVSFGEIYKTDEEEPLEKQKEAINKLLKGTGKRFVIVIDDIDRLDSQETRLVFKLVKMTANFANTVFLLAYDRGKVGKQISENGIEGEEFLKKIVQLSFPLPKPDQQELFRILFVELDEIVREFHNKNWHQGRWEFFFDFRLKKFFQTIRDIKRYVNGLRLDLEIISAEEVNPIDFLGIEAIRIFAPDVYFAMANEKNTFAFPATDSIYKREDLWESLPELESQDEETRKEKCEKVIKKSPADLTETVSETVRWLFPQVDELYRTGDLPPSGNFERQSREQQLRERRQWWRKHLMVCSADIFEKYFSLAVTSGVLSEKDLEDFFDAIDDPSASAEMLKRLQGNDKLYMLLERLSDYAGDLKDRRREKLLVRVLDFMEDATAAESVSLSFSSWSMEGRIGGLCCRTLEKIPRGDRVEFTAKILHLTRGVFSLAYLLDSFNRKIDEYENGLSSMPPLFSTEDMDGLNKVYVGKVEVAAEDGSLADNKRLHYVLSYWKKWGCEEAVKNYASELLKTDDGLLSFLKGFFDGEKIHKDSIKEFIDLDELDKRVNQLDKASLHGKNALLIALYELP